MNKFTKHLLKIVLLFLSTIQYSINTTAQEIMLNPTAMVYQLNSDIAEYVCPDFNIEEMKAEDSINIISGFTPTRFAKKFDVNISTVNSGSWEEIEDYHIWRYKLTSYGAFSMMATLEELNLPEHSSLFVYNEDLTHIVGPITYTVNEYGVLATELVSGSSIIIELIIEGEFEAQTPYLTITGISHDYYDFYTNILYKDKTDFAIRIDNCYNKDINCPIGADWINPKRSVAMIVLNGNAFCSGALINNTNFNGRAFYLTAEHCINSNSLANSSVFYFNHESKECGSKKENGNNYTVSGATLRSTNAYTDFTLLELHGRVPSSYYPYFSGWDKNSNSAQRAIGIHHPKGNLKKIAIDNDNIYPNSVTRTYMNPPKSFPPNTVWDVYFDEGSVIHGSSGSPLFNENKKIIGQLSGSDVNPYNIKCPDRRLYGRLSISWNPPGSTSQSERLKEWLDPNNSNPNEILGYIPEGWRNDWLTGWNQPASHKMHPQIKSLAVGTGGQVFYRGEDNKMQIYWFNSSTNQWVHDWVRGWSIPNYELIAGDVVVGEGNQLFYRGTDGKIHTYYWHAGSWHHDWLTGWNSPSHENVSAVPGSIAVGVGNQLFYRGTDNKMHTYYWNSSGWHHAWIVSGAPSSDNIGGDVVVGTDGGQNQVYYRGTDGKTHVYWYNFSTNQWVHGIINSAATNVSSVAGSMEVGQFNHIYYRGTDNRMYIHHFNSAINAWQTSTFVSSPGNDQKASGNITSMPGQVMYRGADGKMHVYWFNSATNQWVHDWIENSWQAPTLNNVAGSIDAGQGDQVFYRGNDGLVRVYYFGGSAMLRPADNDNENKNFAMIPKYQSRLSMTAYPNPVGDNLNVNISSTQDDTYLFILTDVTGRIVLSQEKLLNQGFNKIDFQLSNNINSGMYILSAQNKRTSEKVNTKITKL